MKKPRVTIVLNESEDSKLDRLAAARGESRSSVVRQMVRDYREAMVTSMPLPGDRRGERGSR
jgi:predicted transcriptional regulator